MSSPQNSSVLNVYHKQYDKLEFSRVALFPEEKNPFTKDWGLNPESDIIGACNMGLKHLYSGTCCVDADDLLALKQHKLWKAIRSCRGIRWTSGKDNRMKYLYRLPKLLDQYGQRLLGFPTVQLPKGIDGSINCAYSTGSSAQDVLPDSIVYDSRERRYYQYRWVDPLPKKRSGIPRLPKEIWKYIKKKSARTKRVGTGVGGGSSYPHVEAINSWCVERGMFSVLMSVFMQGHYVEVTEYTWKRVDSSSVHNIVVRPDGGSAVNYSDNDSQVLPYRGMSVGTDAAHPICAWDVLLAFCAGDIVRARRACCNGSLFDAYMQSLGYESDVTKRVDKIYNPNKGKMGVTLGDRAL